MLKWANTTVQKHNPSKKPIRSFKDPLLTTGTFFLDLLDSLQPGIVDFSMVANVGVNGSYEDRRQNGMFDIDIVRIWPLMGIIAKLAISIARKMNALIFLVPEDIVDVRPRLVCPSRKYHLLKKPDAFLSRSSPSWAA